MNCVECARTFDGVGDWNCELKSGVVQWIICEDCQTPEQNAEAVINDATLSYRTDAFGRVRGTPKTV